MDQQVTQVSQVSRRSFVSGSAVLGMGAAALGTAALGGGVAAVRAKAQADESVAFV